MQRSRRSSLQAVRLWGKSWVSSALALSEPWLPMRRPVLAWMFMDMIYISIDAAWNLSRTIKHSKSLDEIYTQCDYITIHVPLLDSTKEMINAEAFRK